MSYNESSVKRAVDQSGDEIATYQKTSGAHIQAVAQVPIQDVNDIEEIGDITYVGIEDANAVWTLKKIDELSGISVRYATEDNNVGVTTYAAAWAARASLTYETFSQVF